MYFAQDGPQLTAYSKLVKNTSGYYCLSAYPAVGTGIAVSQPRNQFSLHPFQSFLQALVQDFYSFSGITSKCEDMSVICLLVITKSMQKTVILGAQVH